MIRQIRRLTRPVTVDGQSFRAIAVYMERGAVEHADETGYEGVACVDDAARAARLFLNAYRRFQLPGALEEAIPYLQFVQYMQQPDGRFANFILNWQGAKNLTGPTSVPHGPMWNARALWAMTMAAAVTGEACYRESFDRALEPVTGRSQYADVRALHVLAVLELYEETKESALRRCIIQWCDEIAGLRDDQGRLLNWHYEHRPHLWGYVQPAALARASRALGRSDWLHLAEETVGGFLSPLVRAAFPLNTAIAYEVSSVIADLEALVEVTGAPRYQEWLFQARAWFRGRNSARQPVYDPISGAVGDGIDDGIINPNSGAESNIEGAFALIDELPWALFYPAFDRCAT